MEFNLQSDEKIFLDFIPIKGYLWSLFVGSCFSCLFFAFWFALFFGIFSVMAFQWLGLLITLIILIFVIFILPFIVASRIYKMTHYWITNKRIVVKRGFIGYHVNSIPLERISDLIISRSFWESIFGFASLNIQSLAGQVSYNRLGAEASIAGIKNPEALQKQIFDLIEKNRKAQKLGI